MAETRQLIGIAGNIGVGKSSLATLLAQRMGWRLFAEPVSENPYLADFYHDMAGWGFHSQIFFLAGRLNHYRTLLAYQGTAVQDRSLYEDAEIFAYTIHRQGAISDRDWQTYCTLYEGIAGLLPPPDLIVYLRASLPTLLRRISGRGRAFEQAIDQGYLSRLNDRYEAWAASFERCPLLTIETDAIDFVQHQRDLDAVVEAIGDRLSTRVESH